jgi:hypothetical protein
MELIFALAVGASLAGLLIASRVASERGWSFRTKRFVVLLCMFGGLFAVTDAALVFGSGITLRLILLYILTLGFQLTVMAGMLSVHYWMAGRVEQRTSR